jgi:hypothetical protein
MFSVIGFVTVLGVVAAACDGTNVPTIPAAPSTLGAELLSGGAHLTWKDNSSDETQFMVERKTGSAGTFTTVTSVTFNITQYHDAPLTSGTTYTYRIAAMNNAGMSPYSNEAPITIP